MDKGDFLTEMMLNFLRDISNNALAILSFLTTLCLGLTHWARYEKSKKYHIPFKFIYIGVNEVVDIFFVLVILLGGGILAPVVMIFSDTELISIWARLVTIMLSIAIVCMFFFNTIEKKKVVWYKETEEYGLIEIIENQRDNSFSAIIKSLSIMILGFLSIISCWFIALSFNNYIPRIDISRIYVISISILYVYGVVIIGWAFIYSKSHINEFTIFKKSSKKCSVVSINNISYIVAFRHNKDRWILIPYIKKDDEVHFYKGEFLIKDIISKNLTITELRYSVIKAVERKTQSTAETNTNMTTE